MSKNLSNNAPLKSSDKKYIQNFPSDDRFVFPVFDSIGNILGKYIATDGQCILLHQNNTSQYNSMTSEILILRFEDSSNENILQAAHKVHIDIR